MNSGIIPNQNKALIKRYSGFGESLFRMLVFLGKTIGGVLEKYIVENNIDTIVTSGPPHSLHLIGLELKQKLDLKWFADFRDPWTTIGYHKSLRLSHYADKSTKYWSIRF
jgi:hypothetical protein